MPPRSARRVRWSAKPWIQPANAEPETVAEIVRRCPTGALHYVMRDGPAEQPDSPTTITAREDGPVLMRGDLVFEGPAGPMRETRAALCGCAKTTNAPFCDGTCGCKP
jgi:CDGSH-type Zn-finger protein